MSMDAEFEKRLRDEFVAEMHEHLDAMNEALLRLERVAPDDAARGDLLAALHRSAHSLKGAARAVGFPSVEELAHNLEGLFEAITEGTAAANAGSVDVALRALDSIEAAGTALAAGGEAPDVSAAREQLAAAARGGEVAPARRPEEPAPPEQPAPAGTTGTREAGGPHEPVPQPRPTEAPDAPAEMVRVHPAKLDALLAGAGRLLAAQAQIEERLGELGGLEETLAAHSERVGRALHAARSIARSLETADQAPRGSPALLSLADSLSEAAHEAGESAQAAAFLRRQLRLDLRAVRLAVDEVRAQALAARLVPAAELFRPAARQVRDLARDTGKDARVQVVGEETELDRHIVEVLRDPLIHMVRNAVDHGIEPPEERARLGKPPAGTVTLRAEARGAEVRVSVDDDGAGVDLDAVRAAAVRAGLASAEDAERLPQRDVLALIFAPRVSTAEHVSAVSGRGVGLDVVQRNVEAVQGRVEVSSERGRGTRFTLLLPLTLTVARLVLVRAAGQVFGIAEAAVERLIRAGAANLGGRLVLTIEGEHVPTAALDEVLELGGERRAEPEHYILLAAAGRRSAVGVDEVLGAREATLKPLGAQLPRVRNVSGAALLGTGQLVVVLSPWDLARSVWRTGEKGAPPAEPERPQAALTVLVVDDSRTTRTLERQILSAAGYRVLEAGDGAQALAVLANTKPDAVVTDVVMPGMDGLELTRRIRAQEQWRHLPVVLVTAQETREDREAGMDAGADAYLVKRTFDQGALLSALRRLVG